MFTLYGYENNIRSKIIRTAAVAEGIQITMSEVVPRNGTGKAAYMAKFPMSKGKIPGLEVEGENVNGGKPFKLTECIAIAVYIAKIYNKTHLLGSEGTLEQETQVISYMSWANQELLMTLSRWFLPLVPGWTEPAPYTHAAVEKGKADSMVLLDNLESTLADGKTWLVGDSITLADLFVAFFISRGMEWVLGKSWRDAHPLIMAHFERVASWGPTKTITPEFKMVEVERENKDYYVGKRGN